MVTTPTQGQEDWDVTLNAALNDLQGQITDHTTGADPHGDRAYADATFQGTAVQTVADFIAATPMSIAHRGSGGEFPEHTMAAYRSAVAAGAKAIEISVRLTADGVPVCFHDTTLDRTTGATGNIADLTYAELREAVPATMQSLLGAGWSDTEIPTLREALDEFLGRVVIFLEAKSSPSVPVVQSVLTDSYPSANRSVVWKNYYLSDSFPWARSHGYTTWGYIDALTTDPEMDAVDGNIDMWGVPHGSSDAQIQTVVARGKPVIVWEVHRHADVARFLDLGADGLMTSQWLYLNNEPALTADSFARRISAPGTLGVARYDGDFALQYDATGRAYINALPNAAVLMGGHRAATTDSYTIAWSMTWDTLPAATLHSDLAFCRSMDDPYQFSNTNATHGGYGSPGGYHVVLRANGDLQLYKHEQGVTSGTQLGTIASATPVAGVPMTYTLQVTPTQLILTRTDVEPDVQLVVNDTTYRGRYWHLGVGSVTADAEKPFWSDITVS